MSVYTNLMTTVDILDTRSTSEVDPSPDKSSDTLHPNEELVSMYQSFRAMYSGSDYKQGFADLVGVPYTTMTSWLAPPTAKKHRRCPQYVIKYLKGVL